MILGPEYKVLFKGLALEANVPMNRFSNFKVGGPADLLAQPQSLDQIADLVQTARQNDIPVTIMGGGFNTLISDRGIRGLAIVLTQLKTGPELVDTDSGNRIQALAGETLPTLCRFAAQKGLSGLEWAAGIPGTLGGALMMNAGAHGSDMQAITASADVFDMKKMTVRTLGADDLDFKYRKLNLPDGVLIKAQLALQTGDAGKIARLINRYITAKKKSQPVSKASGGCFFKNPPSEHPAGRLIQDAGLKGYKFGGAMVSDLHANFIINHDNARCSDILALKRLVQDRVYDRFGIRLEPEVNIIGQ